VELTGRDKLAAFASKHPAGGSSLRAWAQVIESNCFKHFVDLRKTFGSSDSVRPHIVFNIAGNKYRLIALVSYALQAATVEHVLTHAEYDLGRWRR